MPARTNERRHILRCPLALIAEQFRQFGREGKGPALPGLTSGTVTAAGTGSDREDYTREHNAKGAARQSCTPAPKVRCECCSKDQRTSSVQWPGPIRPLL